MNLKLALATTVLLIAPAPAAAAPVTVEAETLSLPAGTGQAASGALKIWSTATASGSLSSRATRRITVRARGEQCGGAPRMIVSVDGRVALDVKVTATTWTNYAADLALATAPTRWQSGSTTTSTAPPVTATCWSTASS